MKFFKSGQHNPNALDELSKINIVTFIENAIFDRLNHFMKTIDHTSPDTLETFALNMTKLISKYLNHDTIGDYSQDTIPLLKNMSFLNQFPELVNTLINYLLVILENQSIDLWSDNPIQITERISNRLFLIPSYIALEALIASIDRKMAIDIHQKYVTNYLYIHYSENPNFIDLRTMYETRKENNDTSDPWVKIQGMISESKYVLLNVNCLYVESLTDFSDSEIKYQICCYGDFEGAKRHYNKDTILTMEHTIAQGDPYCSKVFHDTRGDWNLKHPNKEFWDTLE